MSEMILRVHEGVAMRFSEYFKINRTDDDDWFDVDLDVDLPYFLDPYLVLQDSSPAWAEARARLNRFYERVHAALSPLDWGHGNPEAPRIVRMSEPREFRLGLGKYSRLNSGRTLRNPLGGIKLPVPDIKGPWEAGVTQDFLRRLGSFDRISDMTCVALKGLLIRYTQDVASRHSIPICQVAVLDAAWDSISDEWRTEFHELPIDRFGQPVILIPENFISGKSSLPGSDFRESEFVEFLTSLLERSGVGQVAQEVRLFHDAVIDITVTTSTTLHIVECKKKLPQTSSRLEEFVGQIKRYGALARNQYAGLDQRLTLATPGKLAATHRHYLASHDISVWDGPWIYQQASSMGLEEEARRYVGDVDVSDNAEAVTFGNRLSKLSPGRESWALYQRLCQEIFEYLFSPPLRTPITESRNENGVNRRDFILPNYAPTGYWEFLRKEYRADYIVVDPKNYAGKVGKERVLQVANYLQRHGTGLFGIIVCRNGADRAAQLTIREQWILHDKMIIVLQDADLLQMLTDKSFGNDPVELIRQKIEDFRLGI
ncbi:hypothetical protein IM697_02135 [Streptomyces ferrugineus]|uniref:Restriction endonuclease type IV Mrr domain-containing protein n=1 Tax=Streptomyces ferrugineus TaxID=1413221 RepID=A0A7M2SM12_9ACTN|nr:hypothetical protein [Streptomyces ferrugineus]QOV37282.1 hypothetical protein IM697_02135 [Streptomyces ferrugineus]